MQCEDIQLDITAYLHGGLPPDRRAEIESHLAACQACSEEAAAMRNLGNMLSRGLKEWVDEGVCPPEVMARIEESLRPARKRSWYQAWPAYAGAVAAVVLILLVASRTTDMSHQIASIPVVGGLAAQLLYPSSDVDVKDLTGELPAQAAGVAEHDGIALEVYLPTLTPNALQVKYSLKGAALDPQAHINSYAAVLAGPHGAMALKRLRIARAADEVLLTAEYDPVLPGQSVTVTVKDLPTTKESAATYGAMDWTVTVKP